MVFKGDMIVVPATLQRSILRHLHKGHMGLEKMLLCARSAFFLTWTYADINNLAKKCETCQKYAPKQGQEKILVHELTETKPWSKLVSDIFDIKGKSYIVIADYYSRFPYVKPLSNITSRSIINVFKTLFADHGFCDILVTYNGPSYVSQKFETFPRDCAPSNISPAVQCPPNVMYLLNQL